VDSVAPTKGASYTAKVDPQIKKSANGKVQWREIRAPSFQELLCYVTSYVVIENEQIVVYRTVFERGAEDAVSAAAGEIRQILGVATGAVIKQSKAK
jgi:hypothetical protein